MNKPAYKIGNTPVFWMREIVSAWNCRNCGKRQTESVAFEILVRANNEHKQIFLCLGCAKELLEETLDRIKLINTRGPDTYMLMDKL